MTTRSKILDEFGRQFEYERRPQGAASIEARYENSMDTVDNKRLWENASLWNINYIADQGARFKLIARSQYTYRNNSYCQGMVGTLADDTIGSGPSLQLVAQNQSAADQLESDWRAWAEEIDLAGKLWQSRVRKCIDGETFAVEETNERLEHPVKLDLHLSDAANFYSINSYPRVDSDRIYGDGVVLDKKMNPLYYERQEYDLFSTQQYLANYIDPDPIPAEFVYHLFRKEHSEQLRGVPEIAPVLHLFEELRRYTLATLAAAETAADLAVVLATNVPYDGQCQAIGTTSSSTTTDRAFDLVDLPRRSMMIAPEGWSPSQLKAEQPVTTYDMFVDKILREIARCLSMPFNVASGDSSDYNYASGRLDHQMYFKKVEIERRMYERKLLNRLFWRWYRERELLSGYSMPRTGPIKQVIWTWPAREHVDPEKEAQAAAILAAAGLLDYDRFWQQQNTSSQEVLVRQAEYLKARQKLGLAEPNYATSTDRAVNDNQRQTNVQ